ncbi:MAG: ubiquinol-cytochrome C chaperone family protein [Pseudomonadota bacterium]
MILSLFRPKNANVNARIVDATFEAIVTAARQPVLFAHWGIPDTPIGRYESVSLHLILFLYRTRDADPLVKALEQDVVDEFFKDIDHSVRELGVGDAGVPKRMKKLARMFYGRMGPYWEALDARDEAALSQAIARNISPVSDDQKPAIEGALLAQYALASVDQLREVTDETILNGALQFQTVDQLGVTGAQAGEAGE